MTESAAVQRLPTTAAGTLHRRRVSEHAKVGVAADTGTTTLGKEKAAGRKSGDENGANARDEMGCRAQSATRGKRIPRLRSPPIWVMNMIHHQVMMENDLPVCTIDRREMLKYQDESISSYCIYRQLCVTAGGG